MGLDVVIEDKNGNCLFAVSYKYLFDEVPYPPWESSDYTLSPRQIALWINEWKNVELSERLEDLLHILEECIEKDRYVRFSF
jgi:hypothetical protein